MASPAAASSLPPALRPLSWELMSGGLQRLVNFHLGGAIYTLPGIVVQAGTARAFVLLAGSASLTLLVYEYLWRTALKCRQGSLARIASALLGRRCALVLRALVVLNALGVIAAYATTVRDIWEASTATPSTAKQATILDMLGSPPGLCFAAVVLGGAGATLFLEAKFAGAADWGSLLANAALLVLIFALVQLAGHASHGSAGTAQEGSVPSLWASAVRFGPNLVFAFSSAEYVLRACEVADDEGALTPGIEAGVVKWRVRAVGAVSVAISCWLYMVMGLSGSMAFGQQTREDILSNFTPPSVGFAAVLGVNALSLVLSFPVFVEALLLYLQELLQEILPGPFFAKRVASNPWLQPSRPLAASAWLVPTACVLIAVLPGLRRVINLVSSATDYYFMFVLPPLAYLASGWRADGCEGCLLAAAGAALAAVAAVMGAISFHAALFEEPS